MNAKKIIRDRQVSWARARGLEPDRKDYLPTYESNLFQPLAPRTYAAFDGAGGSELKDRQLKNRTTVSPAKMRALHSSSGLAVNVFDYWTTRPKAALWRALGSENGSDFEFEKEFETGLPGTPPTLDLAITRNDGTAIGIESKFTEWLTRRPRTDQPLKDKYFEDDRQRWAEVGLPRCQKLAAALHAGTTRYSYLHAAQLLKHALGLAQQEGTQRVTLIYLFFDVPGPVSADHDSDLRAFSEAIGSDLDFVAMTYQDLFERLKEECSDEDREYLKYLAGRYFEDESD